MSRRFIHFHGTNSELVSFWQSIAKMLKNFYDTILNHNKDLSVVTLHFFRLKKIKNLQIKKEEEIRIKNYKKH